MRDTTTAVAPVCVNCGYAIVGPHHYVNERGPLCAACRAHALGAEYIRDAHAPLLTSARDAALVDELRAEIQRLRIENARWRDARPLVTLTNDIDLDAVRIGFSYILTKRELADVQHNHLVEHITLRFRDSLKDRFAELNTRAAREDHDEDG